MTVRMLTPGCSAIAPTDQLVVPSAAPLPPRSFSHVTCVTPTSSAAVPASATELLPVLKVGVVVGEVIVTVGGVASVPDPESLMNAATDGTPASLMTNSM